MILRPYQQTLDDQIHAEWKAGHKVVLVQLPTGGGKTALFASVLEKHEGFAAVLVHRDRLVEQISLTLARKGVRHDLIASDKTKRIIARKHAKKLGQCFYSPGARVRVASVQTLVKAKGLEKWLSQVTLWVNDEGHHCLRENGWGTCVSKFTHPACHGLLVTATPGRPDGKGLGRHADGFADVMIEGPPMRWLIDEGYLCDYDVVCPPSDLIAREAPKGSDGDYTSTQRRDAERNSHIVGDVPAHYVKWASGKSGITFCGTIETATATVEAYRALGVSAELITGETDPAIRDDIFDRAEHGRLNQIVAVDVISEGVDIPALQVGSFARLTGSIITWLQQCLDDQTEILTNDGWKGHREISENHQVAAFDLKNNQASWQPIKSITRRPLEKSESMFAISSPGLDIRVTGGHDMIIRSASQTTINWVKERADMAANRKGLSILPVSGHLQTCGAALLDDEIRLIGWFLSDGTIDRSNGVLSISQSSAKIAHCDEIRRVFISCGMALRETRIKRTGDLAHCPDLIQFRVSQGKRKIGDGRLRGWLDLSEWMDKAIGPIFDTLNERQFDILLNAVHLGDGNNKPAKDWVKNTKTIIFGLNEHAADRFQALAVLRGYKANKAPSISTKRNARWWIVHFKKTDTATLPGANTKDGIVGGKKPYVRSRFQKTESREGELVWCVENPLGTLFIRRNGKVAIVGNCGRILRPHYAPGHDLETREGRLAAIAASNKPRALLLDHVGGFADPSLGPPDKPRIWTLDRREKRAAQEKDPNDIPLRVCTNPAIDCFKPYPRIHRACPYCGFEPQPAGRTAPEQVEGDLQMLDPAALALLRGAVIDPTMGRGAFDAQQLAKGAQSAWLNRHWQSHVAAGTAQILLRASMDDWAGQLHAKGLADHEIQRAFWLGFGVDVLSAQALGEKDAIVLKERIDYAVNGR